MSQDSFDNTPTMIPTQDRGGTFTAVDQFEIKKSLGAGGFGTVYLARDTTSDIEVALKVVGKDRKTAFCSFGWTETAASGGKASELADELRENFKLIHGLTHPNIAVAYPLHQVREVRQRGERVSIAPGDILSVMAYAPGVTLDKWRMQFEGGRVPARIVADIVMQVAAALDYAHDSGVIHRDVKPSNIMVDTRMGCKPIVRLLDFGLAVAADGGQGVCGTPQYMSPEQWGGKRQDNRTDQYSLAVLACELLTGHVPFESVFKNAELEVMRIAVQNREVEFPKGLTAKQRQFLAKAMSKSADDRFLTCRDFAATLVPQSWRVLHVVVIVLLFGALAAGVYKIVVPILPLKVAAPVPTPEAPVSEPAPEPEPVAPAPAPAPASVAPAPAPAPEPVAPAPKVVVPAPAPVAPAPAPAPEPVAPAPKVVAPAPAPAPVAPPPKVVAPSPAPKVQPPKPTLSVAVQTRLTQADNELSDLKRRYPDSDFRKDIDPIRLKIAEAMQQESFDEVGTLCNAFQAAIQTRREALEAQVNQTLATAGKSLDGSDWQGFFKACQEALALEPGNREALDLRRKVNKDFLLRKASAFADAKRWQECKNAVVAVLELDPNNRQAKRLEARADNGLATRGSPRVATPVNTLGGTQDANGLVPFNQRKSDDDWRHRQ